MTTRPRITRTLVALTVLCLSPVTLAQVPTGGSTAQTPDAQAGQRPPRVGEVDKAKTLLHYAVGICVIALCVGVVVVPGRRDHDE